MDDYDKHYTHPTVLTVEVHEEMRRGKLTRSATHDCPDEPNWASADIVTRRWSHGEWSLDTSESSTEIMYCPWCGVELPDLKELPNGNP